MKNTKFTFAVVAANYENFVKTTESIIKVTKGLKDAALILCDTLCTEETKAICTKLEAYNNVSTLNCKGLSESQAFGKALPLSEGDYTIFAEDDQ